MQIILGVSVEKYESLILGSPHNTDYKLMPSPESPAQASSPLGPTLVSIRPGFSVLWIVSWICRRLSDGATSPKPNPYKPQPEVVMWDNTVRFSNY